MGELLRRVWYFLRRRRVDADVAEELELHRALKRHEMETTGMSAADALCAARREMGDVLGAREDARAVWVPPSLDALCQGWRLWPPQACRPSCAADGRIHTTIDCWSEPEASDRASRNAGSLAASESCPWIHIGYAPLTCGR